MPITFELNQEAINSLNVTATKALLATTEDIREEINSKNWVPFDDGTLEISGAVRRMGAPDSLETQLTYSTPYAAKQYFEADLDHSKGPHAGTARSHWMEWSGREAFINSRFEQHMSEYMKK